VEYGKLAPGEEGPESQALSPCRMPGRPNTAPCPHNDASPLARISSDSVVVTQRDDMRLVVAFP